MSGIKDEIYSYLQDYPPSMELLKCLEETGDLYLIGGVLREYKDYGKIKKLRDIDIVIDIKSMDSWNNILKKYNPGRNKFDGYKIECSNLIVDIWSISECWAYRENIIKCDPAKYVENLPQTVFLNMDSIVYDMRNDRWFDKIYRAAKDRGILDVVLEDNPHLELNILRAIILKERYHMVFSEKLISIIKRYNTAELCKKLLVIQEKRYKESIVSAEVINNILEECSGSSRLL